MVIGVDPSINSTGVCVWDGKENTYFNICSKMTKKMKEFRHPRIKLVGYEKGDVKGKEYAEKERIKFNNIYSIISVLKEIFLEFKPEKIFMEGVSYGSVGSAALIDLAMLNASIRMLCMELGVAFEIVSPTELKKFACANGGADKGVMVDAWKRLDPGGAVDAGLKVDDLADAFFLAHYQ